MKRCYADKWSSDVLEQVAATCNVAANTKTEHDWELFLNAIHEAAIVLPSLQRTILLLSQEHGLSFADIGRVLNMPHSTVMYSLARAVDVIVDHLKARSLLDMKIRGESKVAQAIYTEQVKETEINANTRFGFYYELEPPWFYHGTNPLMED